jgi:hypothetical protein
MRFFAAALTATLLFTPAMRALEAPAADVGAVLERPRQRLQTADFRASGHIVHVSAAGVRTSYPITLKAHWFPGVLRLLCEIGTPEKGAGEARAHILLEMRPSGQNSIHVAHPGDKTQTALPFERWSEGPVGALGSVFSYEDFLEPQYFWPGQTVTGNTKYGARLCDLLKSRPGPSDRTHYAEVQTWLDHSIGYPVYVEKTIKATGMVKEFTYFGLRQNGGVWSASQVEVKIRGQAGSTLLIIDRGSTKANLELRDFSPEQLTRF